MMTENREIGQIWPKLPVNFPVSRELGRGDGFASDRVRHHAVLLVAKVSNGGAKAHKVRAFGALKARTHKRASKSEWMRA
jgi:hypothetical protein